jgi:hypothetical protein
VLASGSKVVLWVVPSSFGRGVAEATGSGLLAHMVLS